MATKTEEKDKQRPAGGSGGEEHVQGAQDPGLGGKAADIDAVLVRQADLANLFDVSEARMTAIVRERKYEKNEHGFYRLGPCVREFIQHLKAKVGTRGAKGSMADAQKDNIALKNEMLELQIAEKQGELLAVDDVAKEWERMIVAARQRFLSVPTKAARVLANVSEPMEIQAILENFIREALNELASADDPSKAKPKGGKKVAGEPQSPVPGNAPAVQAPPAP